MIQKNQLFAAEVKSGQEPKKIHTFTVTLEFLEPISYRGAEKFLQRRLAELCDKEFEVN